MSNASVTPPMREHGWNVNFLASASASCFAGIFQLDDMVTFRDVLAEMRLCFEIPGTGADDWSDIAFSFAGLVNAPPGTTTANVYPNLVGPADVDQPVPVPPPASSSDPGERSIVRFHLVRHGHCSLPATASLASHLQAGCAHHIPSPFRRHEKRYLPPKKPSTDPRVARLPLRRTVRARGSSQSPSKRSASGSVSPTKNTGPDGNEEDVTSIVAPPDMHIAPDLARQTIAAFRSSCLVAARKCAVTGKGRSWCITPAVGLAVQACHIVPQQHYHVYPDAEGHGDDDEPEFSIRRLREAWQRTWSCRNGILLLSHLHELFDARLFSIHPETLRVRTFVPYDVISDYHGREAQLPTNVDRNALRHHYDMCCIENMAAQMPLMEPLSETDIGSAISSTTSPLANRPRITAPSGAKPSDVHGQPNDADENGPTHVHNAHGDPSKRARPMGDAVEDEERPAAKRRRTSRDNDEPARYWEDGDIDPPHDPFWEGHITPSNSQYFLADVNWELIKMRS